MIRIPIPRFRIGLSILKLQKKEMVLVRMGVNAPLAKSAIYVTIRNNYIN